MQKLIYGIILLWVLVVTGFSQVANTVGGQAKNDPNVKESARVESKVECLIITDYKYENTDITVKVRNICPVLIRSVLFRGTGFSNMYERADIKPESELEIRAYTLKGLVVEAVLFENGQGSGDSDRLKALQSVFAASRNEIQKIIEILNPFIENPSGDAKNILKKINKQLEALPMDFFDARKAEIGGATPGGKGTAVWRIGEIELKEESNDVEFVIAELRKLKTELEKLAETYPDVSNP